MISGLETISGSWAEGKRGEAWDRLHKPCLCSVGREVEGMLPFALVVVTSFLLEVFNSYRSVAFDVVRVEVDHTQPS